MLVRFLVVILLHPIQKLDSDALHYDGGLRVEPPLGFFDINLVVEDPFIGKGPSDVVDEVKEM